LLCFDNLLTFELLFAGGQIGTVVGMPISGILCSRYGWESVFYFFGENFLPSCVIARILITLFFSDMACAGCNQYSTPYIIARSCSVAEGPLDAAFQLKSCRLLHR